MRIRTLPLALAFSVLVATSGCIGNHEFAAQDQPVDGAALERARLALGSTSRPPPLFDLQWIPLIRMQVARYHDSERCLRAGNTLTRTEAYGPLMSAGSLDESLFDAASQLYERRERSWFLWGLWEHRITRVRTPGGWRVETRPSLLFGLVDWQSAAYESRH